MRKSELPLKKLYTFVSRFLKEEDHKNTKMLWSSPSGFFKYLTIIPTKKPLKEAVLKIQTFLESDIILLMQSFHSLLDARCGTNGRNFEYGKDFKILATAQQVLKVALLFPVLKRGILLSSRKGAWDRVREKLVPLEADGTIWWK